MANRPEVVPLTYTHYEPGGPGRPGAPGRLAGTRRHQAAPTGPASRRCPGGPGAHPGGPVRHQVGTPSDRGAWGESVRRGGGYPPVTNLRPGTKAARDRQAGHDSRCPQDAPGSPRTRQRDRVGDCVA